jgi:hypothetical protein
MMFNRALPLLVLAFVFLAGGVVLADDAKSHDGIVVSAGAGKLTMTDKDGKNEHSHQVAADARVSRDGKECKLDDLKKGDKVTVQVQKKADKEQVIRVDAKSR